MNFLMMRMKYLEELRDSRSMLPEPDYEDERPRLDLNREPPPPNWSPYKPAPSLASRVYGALKRHPGKTAAELAFILNAGRDAVVGELNFMRSVFIPMLDYGTPRECMIEHIEERTWVLTPSP